MKKYLVCSILSFACLNCTQEVSNKPNKITDASFDIVAIADVQQEIQYDSGDVQGEIGLDGGLVDGSFNAGAAVSNEVMQYHGGKVMAAPVNVYFIYYGNWSNSTTPAILEYMVQNFDNTPLYQINTEYFERLPISDPFSPTVYDASANSEGGVLTQFVSSKVNLAKTVYNIYSNGKSLSYTDVQTVIKNEIDNGNLPADPNGAYFIIGSSDIIQTYGLDIFCSDYCSFHSINYQQSFDIKFSFVGDVAQCPDACSLQPEYTLHGIDHSPNNNWSADSMASIIVHELSEMETDPDPFNNISWQTNVGFETGDLCAWVYGTPYYTDDGSVANMKFGDKDYMVQELWNIDTVDGIGNCSLSR